MRGRKKKTESVNNEPDRILICIKKRLITLSGTIHTTSYSFFPPPPPSTHLLNVFPPSGSPPVHFQLQYITLLCASARYFQGSQLFATGDMCHRHGGETSRSISPLFVTDFVLRVSIFLTSLGHIASEIGRKGQSVNAQSDSRYITYIHGDFWQSIPTEKIFIGRKWE